MPTSSGDVAPDHILAIEAAASRAWPPLETEALNGWVLRCGRAGSRRLNSAQTLAFAEADLGAAIAAVERWYDARQLPVCFQLTDAVRPAMLDAELERRGFEIRTPTSVMSVTGWTAPRDADFQLELTSRVDARLQRAIFDPSWSAELCEQRCEVFARITPLYTFAIAELDGTPVAGGLCVVDGELAGLFMMRTQPTHRGRGLARAVACRLMSWAREQRAVRMYLQVEDHNAPALHLYEQLGFTRAYGYHYRELPLRR